MTKEVAYKKISELVERFEEQLVSYKSGEYNETLTRRDFIDPFFKALGWDIDNENGYAEAYREVVHEDRVKVGKATQAPDYSFKLSGTKRLFFVEAKKPSVALKDEILPAYQLRRYGWSDQLAISIITDFEEFAIYDCTIRPKLSDKASVARIRYLTYKEYLTDFDFIWDTFSRERVLKGGLDKFIQSDTNKKGTTTVDKEFLKSLDGWRTYLATSIAINNKELDEDEINFAVQQIIDRLVFLRIAEARKIEPENLLLNETRQGNIYDNLFHLFELADKKYNAGLFDLEKDKISRQLSIDNKVIKTIITDMYFPVSPYEFAYIPVEILGSAYEQFLGKQIKVDNYHRARIEEKPEVRKAGGVYYTPQYIVDYIVKNTLGKLIDERTAGLEPDKAVKEVAKIKIVDPACGSGSFLLGAYQYLLTWHQGMFLGGDYKQNGKKFKNNAPLTPDGRLTSVIKKQILLNNIYGVDIDVNAVEVTKLSLLLKCMEGETAASIAMQMQLFHERVLPTLDNNIKDGNSLIDTDFYDGELDFGEEKKIKPFNWQKTFPEVFKTRNEKKILLSKPDMGIDEVQLLEEPMVLYNEIKEGGFDVVIGNPPYVRQELLGRQKQYFEAKYKVYHGVADLYSYFIEKSIGLLKPGGLYGVIVANKWMRANYGEPLRKWLKSQSIYEIVDFGDLPVFENVTTYPCILIAGKPEKSNKNFKLTLAKTLNFTTLSDYVTDNLRGAEKSSLENSGWNLAPATEQKLLKKIQKAGVPLGEYVKGKIYRGVLTGLNEAFVINEETRNNLIKEDPKSAEIIKPFLAGRDVKKYQQPDSDKYLIFTKRGIEINKYPVIKKHLERYKKYLMPKPANFKGSKWAGRKPGTYKWYEIQDAIDYYAEFEKPKIIYPNILKQPEFTFDVKGWYTNQKCFIISLNDKYLLGILNSALDYYLFEQYLPKLRGGFFEPSYVFFKNFPIKQIDEKNKNEKALRDEIIKNVDLLLELNKEKQAAKLSSKTEHLQTRIDYCEDKINQAVYALYDLTPHEIEIVEAQNKKG